MGSKFDEDKEKVQNGLIRPFCTSFYCVEKSEGS